MYIPPFCFEIEVTLFTLSLSAILLRTLENLLFRAY